MSNTCSQWHAGEGVYSCCVWRVARQSKNVNIFLCFAQSGRASRETEEVSCAAYPSAAATLVERGISKNVELPEKKIKNL